MTGNPALHMGHGQMVEIIVHDDSCWELAFSETGKPDYPAPPVADIRVEAIDGSGAVHPLNVSASGRRSSVMASGNVGGACRARVMVIHGDHFHTREALLPGKSEPAGERGPNGGALIRFTKAAVVAKLVADDTFELAFATPDGAPAAVPAPENIFMQAIGPRAEDYQIRNLAVRGGDRAGTLTASGKVKDATYLRLTLKSGDAAEVRSVPLVRG
jgi:hypothetical protein